MRLLKIPEGDLNNLLPQLIDFPPDRIPPYAILSHRWGAPSDEVLFADIYQCNVEQEKITRAKKGYIKKLRYSCMQALADGLGYIWIDTCCIDKSSSAELSEAINSMYAWYDQAVVCYVYLDDVPTVLDPSDCDSKLTKTLWATRGWTLQELLAPSTVIFYSVNWIKIGQKDTLSSILSRITGIDEVFLTKRKPLESASIAKRMSWASGRRTTRPEDIAYCLMGIFSVNMPMLYGEGNKAFLRLQEEIMKHSDDHSLFAWTDEEASPDCYHGLLADHPSRFKQSNSMVPYQDREIRKPFSMSNRGLSIELYLTTIDPTLFAAALDCPVPPNLSDSSFLAIYLKKLSGAHNQYARVKVGLFGEIHKRGTLETIYVRQNIILPDIEGIYPTHVLQLRNFTTPNPGYRVSKVIVAQRYSGPFIKSSKMNHGWIPVGSLSTCKIINKAETALLCTLRVVYEETEEFLIMLGSSARFGVGFGIVETHEANLNGKSHFETLRRLFDPQPMGAPMTLGYHRVNVTAEPLVAEGAKYYMIDIQVDAMERPPDVLDEIINKIEDIVVPGARSDEQRSGRFKKLRRAFGREDVSG